MEAHSRGDRPFLQGMLLFLLEDSAKNPHSMLLGRNEIWRIGVGLSCVPTVGLTSSATSSDSFECRLPLLAELEQVGLPPVPGVELPSRRGSGIPCMASAIKSRSTRGELGLYG